MKIEERLKEIAKSPYKDSCIGKYAEFYIEDLLVLFDEYAKSYVRSLVPESCPDEVLLEVRRHQGWSDDEIVLYVWGKSREEMLRRIEEG